MGKRFFLDDVIGFASHNGVWMPAMSEWENFPSWTAPEQGRIELVPPLGGLYESRLPELYAALWRQAEAAFRTVTQIDMVKLVIFDLDNTMWRGQIAEHYQPGQRSPFIDNWPLGVWETVHHLRSRGIAVAIASKNDLSVVESKWDDAVPLPFVKLDDFVTHRINWNPKAESIREIIDELSLTAKSVVFVDDNPVEREAVHTQIPDIRVIGDNPFELRRILLWSPETQVASLSAESGKREDMFRRQFARESEKKKLSREEFLASLACEVEFIELTSPGQMEVTRSLELVNKSNQFNTTGKRWTFAEFSSFLAEGGKALAFKVKDRFVEYGIVGVIFIEGSTIAQFVMSCRVLGMEVERAVIGSVIETLPGPAKAVRIESDSNSPSHDLYSKCGFSEEGDNIFVMRGQPRMEPARHVTIIASAIERAGMNDLREGRPGALRAAGLASFSLRAAEALARKAYSIGLKLRE